MPNAQKKPTKQPPPPPTPVEDADDLIDVGELNPLAFAFDLMTGAVFDGPKKAVAAAAPATEGASDDEDGDRVEARTPQGPVVINLGLGDIFKRSKRPKPAATAEAGAGTSTGGQESA